MTTPVSQKDLAIDVAKAFKELISSENYNLYLTIGRPGPWTGNVPNANTSYTTTTEVWQNLYGGKKIVGSDFSHVVPRYNWTSGVKYDQWDHTRDYDANSNFYVLTSANNVYKCISNNYGIASTTEPTSISTTNITQTMDGYKWKFMYNISVNEQNRFLTDSHMPVKTLTIDNDSLQWDVQQNAVKGAIYHIDVIDGGTGYSNTQNISITIRGDGEGASGFVGINNISNSVNSITMTLYGSDYSYADVEILGEGFGANAKAYISPGDGHGSDPVYELNGHDIIINPRIEGTENGKLSIENEIRQIALISNPKIYGSQNLISNSVFSQEMTVTVANYGSDYYEDEIVYQGSSYKDSVFSAQILEWDPINFKIKLINIKGTPISDVLVGLDSGAARVMTSIIKYPDCENITGHLIYVENIEPIQRDEIQTESFKLIFQSNIKG